MCGRAPAVLLPHLNLLLTLYGGAALATAARLKWDPITYVPVRELFPAEYRAAASALTVGGAALLLLPHLACAAATLAGTAPRVARRCFLVYAVLMSVLMVGELVFGAWLALQVMAWLNSEVGQQLGETYEHREDVQEILSYLRHWFPALQRISDVIQEAQEDAPRNLVAALWLAALLALLQLLAVALALLAAYRLARRRSHLPLQLSPPSCHSAYKYQKMPRTAYKNGRIVVLDPPRLH